MTDPPNGTPRPDRRFPDVIGRKAEHKARARRHRPRVWSGLGLFGLVGWSIVIPTLLGAAAGLWLDEHHPGGRSWTLALLVAGLVLGCWNAWRWVASEERNIHDDDD